MFAFGPLALLGFITVGSMVSDAARSLLALLPIDPTFTGRTEVWRYALDTILVNPLKGMASRRTGIPEGVRYSGENYTRWMVEVGTSHNGYVDLALTTGLPGLVLFILAFLVRPLRVSTRRSIRPIIACCRGCSCCCGCSRSTSELSRRFS